MSKPMIVMHLKASVGIGKTERFALPNLKEKGLIPQFIEIPDSEYEITFMIQNTPLFKYTEAYLNINKKLDLRPYNYKINEGEDLYLSVKNTSKKKEMITNFQIEYYQSYGTILYQASIDYKNDGAKCLQEISDAGKLSRLVIRSNTLINSLSLDPNQYSMLSIEDEESDLATWNDKLIGLDNTGVPCYEMDLNLIDCPNYTTYLKYYTLVLGFDETDLATKLSKKEPILTYVVAYGFK